MALMELGHCGWSFMILYLVELRMIALLDNSYCERSAFIRLRKPENRLAQTFYKYQSTKHLHLDISEVSSQVVTTKVLLIIFMP